MAALRRSSSRSKDSSKSPSAADVLARSSWKPLPPMAAFAGSASFFRERLVARFAREIFGAAHPDISRYQGPASSNDKAGELPLATVLDDLRTPSFLTPRRLIVVDRADTFVRTNADILENYVATPFAGGHLALCLERKPDGRTKFGRALAETGWLVECATPFDRPPPWQANAPVWDSPLSHWVVRHGKSLGLELDAPLAFALHDRVGTELQAIHDALDKIATLLRSRGAKEVTEEIIQSITGDVREDSIFALVDLILEGRRAEALSSAERLFDRGYHNESGQVVRDAAGIVLPLVATLAGRLRALRRAHALSARGESSDAWLRHRLVQSPFLERFRRQLRATPPARVRRLLRDLYEIDTGLKRGVDPRHALVAAIADLAPS